MPAQEVSPAAPSTFQLGEALGADAKPVSWHCAAATENGGIPVHH